MSRCVSGGFRRLLLLILASHTLILQSAEVEAQSFLEKLFGGSSQPQAPQQPVWQAPQGPPLSFAPRQPNPWLARREDDDGLKSGGTWRTLCVRMCDGFYFPVSHATTRSKFYRDATQCRATCGEDAVLFFHATKGDQNDMVDLTGRAYARLPVAFRYRKQLVDGCRCRPDPWAVSELERHRGYQMAEADEKARKQAVEDAVKDGEKSAPAQAKGDDGAQSEGETKSEIPAAKVAAARLRPRPEARPRPLPVAQHAPPQAAPQASWFSSGAKGGLTWPGDR